MKLRFLGTGAADWSAADAGTEGYRRYTSTLINDRILIDGTLPVLEQLNGPVTDVFFTHSHRDHFDAELVAALSPCRVYAHRSWADRIAGEGLEVIPLDVGEPVTLPCGTVVTPLPSNHVTENWNETTLHYLIEGDRRLLYATDGAWLLCREHRLIGDRRLDAAVFDATIGDIVEGDFRIFEHNSLDMLRLMLKTMNKTGRLPEGAPVFLTHMAKTLHPDQATLERTAEPPFIVCRDGMEATL